MIKIKNSSGFESFRCREIHKTLKHITLIKITFFLHCRRSCSLHGSSSDRSFKLYINVKRMNDVNISSPNCDYC